MAAKKGLGRGFDSLIPDNLFDESFDPTQEADDSVSQLRVINLADIVADPEQPRKHFDEAALEELTQSIRRHGVLQPIVVTKQGSAYEIIAGERRFRASKRAGNTTIPALVRSIDGQERLELALIENLQRHDLNALETAIAYAKLRDQFNLTLEQIGQAVGGKSVSTISNTLRLLKLAPRVQEALGKGVLTEGQARPLIGVSDDEVKKILPRLIEEKWSARTIETEIRKLKAAATPSVKQQVPHRYESDNDRLSERLRTSVKISATAKGGGKVVISFKDEAEFKRIRDAIL